MPPLSPAGFFSFFSFLTPLVIPSGSTAAAASLTTSSTFLAASATASRAPPAAAGAAAAAALGFLTLTSCLISTRGTLDASMGTGEGVKSEGREGATRGRCWM